MSDFEVKREIGRRTRRSLFTGGLAALAGAGAWKWMSTRRSDDDLQWPLRIGLRVNEQVSRDLFQPRLARTFSNSDVQPSRLNGDVGLDGEATDWKLTVTGAGDKPLTLSLADIQALPKVEMVTELKCIEGWSRIQHWGGARFHDFTAKYAPDQLADSDGYVGLTTPDGQYYVGLDAPSALHPQTLLAYEMQGQPLTPPHGAPLRLVIPLKYGIKNLKRIGAIAYSDVRTADYWAENGYDWYAGF